MNPDTELLLKEIQKLAAAHVDTQKQIADVNQTLQRSFGEIDASIDKRFQETDFNIEQWILDSELRLDMRLQEIEKEAGDIHECRQQNGGIVDDLCLRLNKLDKFYNRTVIETPSTEQAIFLDPPVKTEQHVAFTFASYQAARPSGHGEEHHHRDNGYGVERSLEGEYQHNGYGVERSLEGEYQP